MTRILSNLGLAFLVTLLVAAPFGCGKNNTDANQNAEQSAAQTEQEKAVPLVNYSMAEPVKLVEISNRQQFDSFVKDHEIAVVKMGATWCPPCKKLSPELEKMAGYFQTENVAFADIDVDKFDEIAREMKVGTIPFTAVYYNGNLMQSFVGYEPGSIASLVESFCQKEVSVKKAPEDAKEAKDAKTTAETKETVKTEKTEVVKETKDAAADGEDDDFVLEIDEPEPAPAKDGYQAPEGPYSKSKPIKMKSVTKIEEFETICKEHKYVVVEFGAEWCVWCKRLHPELAKIGGYYEEHDVYFVEVDVDVATEIAEKYNVSGIPHTFLFLDGKEYVDVVGCDPLKINVGIEALVNGEPAPVWDDDDDTDDADADDSDADDDTNDADADDSDADDDTDDADADDGDDDTDDGSDDADDDTDDGDDDSGDDGSDDGDE
ncbi:MAG: thioredoxin family protein [Thermoguttaceae bacterium]|nr:thioredoxin family protein [Thermoguttaceae bacterium]